MEDQPAPTHTDPTHEAYEPHPHLSLLHPWQSLVDTETAAEYAVVNMAFGIIAHLPPPKPQPSPFMALAKKIGMPFVNIYKGFSQCNGVTNNNLKAKIIEHPIDLLPGAGIYAATLAVSELTEFASHQMHTHADTGSLLHLPRPDPRHGAYACPDE